MKQRVLRRNRRTASAQQTRPFARRVAQRALVVLSLVIFLGGMAQLAWALDRAHDQQAPPPATPTWQQPDATQELYGDLLRPDIPADENSQADTQASPPGDSAGEPTAAIDEHPAEDDAEGAFSPWQVQEPDPITTMPSTQSSTPAHIVHHNAGREQAVYRTVHHQASQAREITVNGVASIEWTRCPVCSQQHEGAYNERVLDHVNRVGCNACGAWHDSDFDEVVSD